MRSYEHLNSVAPWRTSEDGWPILSLFSLLVKQTNKQTNKQITLKLHIICLFVCFFNTISKKASGFLIQYSRGNQMKGKLIFIHNDSVSRISSSLASSNNIFSHSKYLSILIFNWGNWIPNLAESKSTSFPLPSSPHWEPTMTVAPGWLSLA